MAFRDPERRSLADLRAFARAWGVLLAVDLASRAVSFARLERRLKPAPAGPSPDEPDEAAVGRLVWSAAAAARHHLYPIRCIPRALTLRWLLGRHGLSTVLKIGVLRQDGALRAHAWVERDGRAIGEPAGIEERFAVLGTS